MTNRKEAQTDIQILDLLKKRWSPRAFRKDSIESEKLVRIFEAARWSASSFNEQPWRFLVGQRGKGDTFNKILNTLMEGNRVWCKDAPLLLLVVAKQTFTSNGKPNAYAAYDCGQAAAYLSIQAMQEGIYMHQMAGFSVPEAIKAFNIPQDFKPVTAIAAGYLGKPDHLPENLQKSETAARKRNALDSLLYENDWGQISQIF